MRQIENRFREIRDLENQHHTVVVYCHSGIRSGMVSGFLRKHGFEKIVNLQGGIDAWSTEVDAKVPRY
jgi:rhodanese-related sulfurtransferase